MTNDADLFAAPLEVTIRGQEYKLSPPTIKDIAEFNRWMQGEYLNEVFDGIDAAGDRLTAEEIIQIKRDAYANLENIRFGRPRSHAYLQSVSGISRFLWLMVRRNHPSIGRLQVEQWVTDPDVLREFQRVVEQISGPPENDSPDPQTATT